MKYLLILMVLVITFTSNSFANQNPQLRNKKIVKAFYELAFNQHKPQEAMKLYVGKKYIQHNPYAGDGQLPFIKFFTDYYVKYSMAYVEIKRIIAEGDLVVVHVHSRQNKSDRGSAVIDIFRLEQGKIVEHWDVVQTIPEKAANNNSMF